MKIQEWPLTFDEAIITFVNSLDEGEVVHFLSLKGFNPHSEESAKYWDISRRFGIHGQKNVDLLKDIAKKNPEKVLSMDFLAELPDEFHAVDIILEKAREVLSEKRS